MGNTQANERQEEFELKTDGSWIDLSTIENHGAPYWGHYLSHGAQEFSKRKNEAAAIHKKILETPNLKSMNDPAVSDLTEKEMQLYKEAMNIKKEQLTKEALLSLYRIALTDEAKKQIRFTEEPKMEILKEKSVIFFSFNIDADPDRRSRCVAFFDGFSLHGLSLISKDHDRRISLVEDIDWKNLRLNSSVEHLDLYRSSRPLAGRVLDEHEEQERIRAYTEEMAAIQKDYEADSLQPLIINTLDILDAIESATKKGIEKRKGKPEDFLVEEVKYAPMVLVTEENRERVTAAVKEHLKEGEFLSPGTGVFINPDYNYILDIRGGMGSKIDKRREAKGLPRAEGEKAIKPEMSVLKQECRYYPIIEKGVALKVEDVVEAIVERDGREINAYDRVPMLIPDGKDGEIQSLILEDVIVVSPNKNIPFDKNDPDMGGPMVKVIEAREWEMSRGPSLSKPKSKKENRKEQEEASKVEQKQEEVSAPRMRL